MLAFVSGGKRQSGIVYSSVITYALQRDDIEQEDYEGKTMIIQCPEKTLLKTFLLKNGISETCRHQYWQFDSDIQ